MSSGQAAQVEASGFFETQTEFQRVPCPKVWQHSCIYASALPNAKSSDVNAVQRKPAWGVVGDARRDRGA